MTENIPSIRVLKKIGLLFWKEDGTDGVIYKIEKENLESNR
jgi:hypothetical protein